MNGNPLPLNALTTRAFWIGTAVGLALLVLAARSVDFAALLSALHRANVLWVPPFLVALLGFYALKAVRWGLLLRNVGKIPFRLLFRAVMIGYAANALLPAQLGDVVRALVAAREMGLRTAPLLTTVVVERVFDLIAVAALLAAVVLMHPGLPAPVANAGQWIVAGCLASVAFLFVYARYNSRVVSGIAKAVAWLPAALKVRLLEALRSGADGAASVASIYQFSAITGLTLLKWLLMAGCNQISLIAIGVSAPPEASLLVLACTVLALVLPSAPGYVGAIQFAYVFGLAPFGVSATDAIAASVFFHALSYLTVIVLGAGYLHGSGYRLADLSGQVEIRK